MLSPRFVGSGQCLTNRCEASKQKNRARMNTITLFVFNAFGPQLSSLIYKKNRSLESTKKRQSRRCECREIWKYRCPIAYRQTIPVRQRRCILID